MTAKLKLLLNRYREQVMYLIFGVATTVVSYGVFWAFHRILGNGLVELTNVISFIAAVIFAYITNKLFVFNSRSWKPALVAREALSFLSSRIASFVVEELGISVCMRLLHFDRITLLGLDGALLSKLGMSVIVVILNYFLSKYLVFTGKKES